MRILIVCEHASARFGGEAILPLHWFKHLRLAGDEVWLVSHARTREEVTNLFPDAIDKFYFVEDTRTQQRLSRIRNKASLRIVEIILDQWIHLITQLQQKRVVRDMVQSQSIEWVLEPMPVSPRQPSLMFNVGAPVVIGPMNGGMSYPPRFRYLDRWTDRLMIPTVRSLAALAHFVLPGKRQARLLLVANERTKKALPWSLRRVPTMELVENGIDTSKWRPAAALRSDGCGERTGFSFAYVGRLVDWKSVDLLIEALSRVKSPNDVSLHIYGDGPDRAKLEQQARTSKVNRQVIFHGFVPQEKLPARLSDCDCLVLPSLRECGGAVVLEAMALGLPVIATNWGGPADYLDNDCGILVDPAGRDAFLQNLQDAMEDMVNKPGLAIQLGSAASYRALSKFTWTQKTEEFRGMLFSAMKK